MRKSILLLCALFTFSAVALSQDFVVPANYKLKEKGDYTKYEQDMISAAHWLVNTPLNEQTEKRREVSRFVFEWVNGSPTVSVEINPTIMDFEKKNPGMLFIYMATCARFVLENNYSTDMRAKHRFALREMIKVYNNKAGIEKDKKMEKLVKADAEGKIDEWIASNLKIQGH